MKHIEKDYQNVANVGERNDEDQAVPSVMKLVEKVTDAEVDEMIPETDVDDTQCSEHRADVSVPQIADRIVEVVTALRWSESQNEPSHRSSTCRETNKRFSARKQSEIIKKTVQRKSPIIRQKINQVSKQKENSIQSQHN